MRTRGTIRTAVGVLAVLTVAMLASTGCSDEAAEGRGREPQVDPRRDDPRREDAVEAVTAGLVDYPRADYRSDDQPRCIAEEVVDAFGVARLEEIGMDLDPGEGPDLFAPHITEAERDDVAAAYDTCLDVVARDVEAFVDGGLTDDQALCVSRAYRSSGIPRNHLTETPHGDDLSREPERVRRAHALLDDFLNVAKAACEAWTPEGTAPGEPHP